MVACGFAAWTGCSTVAGILPSASTNTIVVISWFFIVYLLIVRSFWGQFLRVAHSLRKVLEHKIQECPGGVTQFTHRGTYVSN